MSYSSNPVQEEFYNAFFRSNNLPPAQRLKRLEFIRDYGYNGVAATDDDIHYILCQIARWNDNGSGQTVAGIRMLCGNKGEKLSQSLQQKYKDDNMTSNSPLHNEFKNAANDKARIEFWLQFCNVNQKNHEGHTPLSVAAGHGGDLETIKLLMDTYGADINLGGEYGPVYEAVENMNTQTALYLLDCGADPNLNRKRVSEEDENQRLVYRCTDHAIANGDIVLLSALLKRGAYVGICEMALDRNVVGVPDGIGELHNETSLSGLLHFSNRQPMTKLKILDIVYQHAKKNPHTRALVLYSFRFNLENVSERYKYTPFLHDQNKRRALYYIAIAAQDIPFIHDLVQVHDVGGNPFLEVADDHNRTQAVAVAAAAVSPFQAAARIKDNEVTAKSILRLFLSDGWNERFTAASAAGGPGRQQQQDGDSLLHRMCRDSLVSVHAIKLLVDEFQANVAQRNARGLLPLHLALMSNASAHVIYYLMTQHPPDFLLGQPQQQLLTAAVAMDNDASEEEQLASQQQQQQVEGNLPPRHDDTAAITISTIASQNQPSAIVDTAGTNTSESVAGNTEDNAAAAAAAEEKQDDAVQEEEVVVSDDGAPPNKKLKVSPSSSLSH